MGHWLDEARYRHEGVTIPRIWVTIAFSLLLHGAALLLWLPRMGPLASWAPEQDQANDRLQVRLTAIPKPTPVSPPEATRETLALAKPAAPPPRATLRSRPPPVVTAPIVAAPAIPASPPIQPPAPEPPQASLPTAGDLWEYIQARRRERGDQGTPSIDQGQSHSIAANLPAPATGVINEDRRRGGGIFEIKRMDYDDAAFEFFGWNNEMGRKTPQLIEVRKGNNSDMRIAVVRRMIAIIREFSSGDFIWRSPRRGEDLVLSARPADNAALENFLLHEFWADDPRRLQ